MDNRAKTMRNIEPLEKAFFQISSMIIGPKSLETILDLIVRESINCLEAHRVTVFFMDEKSGSLNVQFTHYSAPEYAQVGLFVEKGVALSALKQGKSLLLKEPEDFLEFIKNERAERKITSLLCIPLSLLGKANRVISAVLINPARAFDEKDLQLLSTFANHASIAMENSYLNAEVRKAVSFRRSYEQQLDNIQSQLQDLAKKETQQIEHNIQRFLPEQEQGKSSDYKAYSNALSKTFDIPIISLKGLRLNPLLQKAIGEKYAESHKVVVLENSADKIKLALAEPTRYIMDELRRIIPPRKIIDFCLADPDEVRLCFKKTYDPFSISRFR